MPSFYSILNDFLAERIDTLGNAFSFLLEGAQGIVTFDNRCRFFRRKLAQREHEQTQGTRAQLANWVSSSKHCCP